MIWATKETHLTKASPNSSVHHHLCLGSLWAEPYTGVLAVIAVIKRSSCVQLLALTCPASLLTSACLTTTPK